MNSVIAIVQVLNVIKQSFKQYMFCTDGKEITSTDPWILQPRDSSQRVSVLSSTSPTSLFRQPEPPSTFLLSGPSSGPANTSKEVS
ncbi:hypothetical protein DPMN_066960 [Dreissena polymorpha]|uniref:Uncharacterized protein n=1 Tax=Dreissena polymorpha TaxID=45954 RepID=A0A9D3YUG3_DREPO|nr:hypothetical protein DPMN_066960 [Dreissena polymorpha]